MILSENLARRQRKLRGVNLGGWLVLEKWMTPSLFQGLQAEDETRWCLELGDQAERVLREHWQSFITRKDFDWLASIGINAIRIPVGYWLFAADYPYHASFGDNPYPFVTGGLEVLDLAFDWASACGLAVIIDLHCAPGCQNGFDNGGLKDICEWHTQQHYQDYALTTLQRIAERYGQHPALYGIEVLNEPHWDIPTEILLEYTQKAYQCIRHYCPAKQIAVVMHDGFRTFQDFKSILANKNYDNLMLDIHRYQCFQQEDIDTDLYGHLARTVIDWKNEADAIITHAGCLTYVGEWSLGLNPNFINLWELQTSAIMDDFQQQLAYRAFAAAQLLCFEKYQGWFFWSYKTETMLQWSFRDCVAKGWLPEQFF